MLPSVRRLLPLTVLGFAFLLPGAPSLRAQTTPSADAPPPASTFPDEAPVDTPATTLKVNVNLVSLYFTVRDKHNGLIPTLAKSDCSILEDKQPQTIKNFSAETDLPLTLGIMVDTSGSQERVLPLEQQAADNFLRSLMRKKDEAFVVSFDVGVNLEQDFTNNVSELQRAIDKTEINTAAGGGSVGVPGIGQGPVPTHGAPKGTLLYDAVAQVSNDKIRSETGRKALILLTDGEDEGSVTKPNQAIEAAQKANAIIYVGTEASIWATPAICRCRSSPRRRAAASSTSAITARSSKTPSRRSKRSCALNIWPATRLRTTNWTVAIASWISAARATG
jgi:VWFA-related protein